MDTITDAIVFFLFNPHCRYGLRGSYSRPYIGAFPICDAGASTKYSTREPKTKDMNTQSVYNLK